MPHARIETPPGQDFQALALTTYAGDIHFTRALFTPCTVYRYPPESETLASRQDALSNDRVTLSVQYGGMATFTSPHAVTDLPLGLGRFTCTRFPYEITYSGLTDLLLVNVPISRIAELAEKLRILPANLFPDTALVGGTFAFLSRFMFQQLLGIGESQENESEAENAIIALARAALPSALEVDEEGGTDPEVRRIVNSEIEVHHRDPGLTVDSIAAMVGMSRRQLYRVTGDQLAKKLDLRRSESARELIETDPDLDLTVVARLSGFTNATRLRDNFVRAFGILPSEFRARIRKRPNHLSGTNSAGQNDEPSDL